MPDPNFAIHPDVLLASEGMIRGAARRVLADAGQVDDVVQETWLAALRLPPGSVRDASRWLVRVASNLARRVVRSDQRRKEWEREVAEARGETIGPEITAAFNELVGAILRLTEPYRTTLLLRYYRGLQPSEIARLQGVPAATVRTRLRRALARVREDLPESDRHNGLGVVGLAPLAGLRRAGRNPPPFKTWGLLMAAKSKAALSLAVLCVAVLLAGIWLMSDREASREGRTSFAPATDRPTETPGVRSRRVSTEPFRPEGTVPSDQAQSWTLRADRRRGRMRGFVTRGIDGTPVPGAVVTARPTSGPIPLGQSLREDRVGRWRVVSDAAGAFELRGLPEGPYLLDATSPGGQNGRAYGTALPHGASVRIQLPPFLPSRGPIGDLMVLVQTAERVRVAGATVTLWRSGKSEDCAAVTTDDRGLAEFTDLRLRRGVILIRGPEGRVARCDLGRADLVRDRLVPLTSGEKAVVVTLDEPGGISGHIANGANVSVTAWARSWNSRVWAETSIPFRTTTDGGGAFRILGLPAGRYDITVDAGKQRADLVAGKSDIGPDYVEYEPVQVEVRPGSVAELSMSLRGGATLEGRVVHGQTGRPIRGATVRAVLPQGSFSDPDRVRRFGVRLERLDSYMKFRDRNPQFAVETATDAEGRYRLEGLLPGPDWYLDVTQVGLSFDRIEGINLVEGERVSLLHRLHQAGGVQGVAPPGQHLGLRRKGDPSVILAFLPPKESHAPFTLLGLSEGTYEFVVTHFKDVKHFRDVHVEAGRLSWIDLRTSAPHWITGRVLHQGRPVPDIGLMFSHGEAVTNAAGIFRHHFTHVYAGVVGFRIHAPTIRGAVPLRAAFPRMFDGSSRWNQDIRLPSGIVEVKTINQNGVATAALVTLDRAPSRLGLTEDPPMTGRFRLKSVIARRSTPDGMARFALVPDGLYDVIVEFDDGTITMRRRVEVANGKADPVVVACPRGGHVTVHVVDAAGCPVGGSYVAVLVPVDGKYEWLGYGSVTDNSGHVEFLNVPTGTVKVMALGLSQSKVVEIVEGLETRIVFVSEEKGGRR